MSKLSRIDPGKLLGNPRATEPAWRKYEVLAMLAYKNHPAPYVWEPDGMEPSTVCTRLRDAIRGCLAFKHTINPIYSVTHDELARWFDEIIIKNTDTRVYVGRPERVADELAGTAVGNAEERKGFSFPSLDFEEVNAFAFLLSRGRILGPVMVTNPPDVTLMQDRSNVEVMLKPDGKLILL